MDWILIVFILIQSALLHWSLGRIVDLEKELRCRTMDADFFRRKWLKKGCWK
jgi:hypothetical protein